MDDLRKSSAEPAATREEVEDREQNAKKKSSIELRDTVVEHDRGDTRGRGKREGGRQGVGKEEYDGGKEGKEEGGKEEYDGGKEGKDGAAVTLQDAVEAYKDLLDATKD